MRSIFVDEFAERKDGILDPLERWPDVPPKPFKSLVEMKRSLTIKCYPYVTDKKQIHRSAKQLVAFATRIKPISDMYWTILKGNVAGKGKKHPPQGVSTFCHLEGATDNECINILNLVQLLSSHSVDNQGGDHR